MNSCANCTNPACSRKAAKSDEIALRGVPIALVARKEESLPANSLDTAKHER